MIEGSEQSSGNVEYITYQLHISKVTGNELRNALLVDISTYHTPSFSRMLSEPVPELSTPQTGNFPASVGSQKISNQLEPENEKVIKDIA